MSSPPAPKPRANVHRRSKAERDAQAREDEKRRQEREAEAKKGKPSTAPAQRGKTAGRGRGNAQRNQDPNDRVRAEGSGGVFGSAIPGGTRPKPGRLDSVGSGGLSELVSGEASKEGDEKPNDSFDSTVIDGRSKATTSHGKKAAAAAAGASSENKDEILYVDSDEGVDDSNTRDIERIWISSDEEKAEDGLDKEDGPIARKDKERQRPRMPKPGAGLRPIRAPRQLRTEEIDRKKTGVGDEIDLDEQFSTEAPSSPEFSRKPKRKNARVKDIKSQAIETIEERAERLRYAEDVRKLKDVFSGASKANRVDAEATPKNRDGKLYLFQFPPLTPYLVDETANFEINDHLEDPDLKPAQEVPIKKENEVKKEEPPDSEAVNIKAKIPGALTAKSPRLPSGFVGRLNVHKSGKVSLDWGGTDMEVRYGSEVDFLQDAVLVSGGGERREGEGDGVGDERMSWALGQVVGKMVVVPDWGRLYD